VAATPADATPPQPAGVGSDTRTVEDIRRDSVITTQNAQAKVAQREVNANLANLWFDPTFTALFEQPFHPRKAKAKVSPTRCTGAVLLVQTALSQLLSRHRDDWLDGFDAGEIQQVQQLEFCLATCLDLTKKIPAMTGSNESFVQFLNEIRIVVNRMTPGQFIMLPGGWARTTDGVGHQMLYIVHRLEHTSTFAVVNTGDAEALAFHPVRIGKDAPTTEYKQVVAIDDAQPQRLNDGSFWFMLYRMLVYPHAVHGPDVLFKKLAPYLNDMPFKKTFAAQTAEDARTPDFAALPVGGDNTDVFAVMEALTFMLLRMGISKARSYYFVHVLLRAQVVEQTLKQLESTKKLTASERLQIGGAARQLAVHTAAQARRTDVQACISVAQVESMRALAEAVDARLAELPLHGASDTSLLPPLLDTDKLSDPVRNQFRDYPFLFDRMKRVDSVEGMAGPADIPPPFRSVDLSLIPRSATTFAEVTAALRNADHICTLLAYQKKTLKNTYLLRVSLIQHLFTAVLPVPLPLDHEEIDRCLWASVPIEYETQVDILKSIAMLTRHFSLCCLSLKVSRSFDAARVLTLACMATIADAVMRRRSCDVPSMFCLHYNGQGPPSPRFFRSPFGFDMGPFAVESECMKFSSPELVATRTRVLDYFVAQRRVVKDNHLIFQWDESPKLGNARALLQQLCWDMGFPEDEEVGGASALVTFICGFLSPFL
jgi:hypothetical protein